MTIDQTKEAIRLAQGSWDLFEHFMRGQTVGMYPDGSTDFYEDDVHRFIRNNTPRGTNATNIIKIVKIN